MYSFLISIAALILGYIIYGRVVERIFGPDPSRATPAVAMNDGVDFVPMPTWKVYMIQFLNIAGTGPIFGAIMGAKFGPSCYLWIVFGLYTNTAPTINSSKVVNTTMKPRLPLMYLPIISG